MYSFHMKNFAILTKFSDCLAEKLSMCKIVPAAALRMIFLPHA